MDVFAEKDHFNITLESVDFIDLLETTRKINIHFIFVIIIFGIIGHILTIFVYGKKRFRTNSSTVYILCLSINDCFFLIVHFFEDTIRTYIDIYLLDTEDSLTFIRYLNITDRFYSACVLTNYLRNVLRFISAYIVVAFTIQRVYITYSPLSSKFKSNKSAWFTVFSIFIISILTNLWILGFFELHIVISNQYCDIKKRLYKQYFVLTFIYTCLVILIPIVIIFIGNFLIIFQSHKNDSKRQSLQIKMNSNPNLLTKPLNPHCLEKTVRIKPHYFTTDQIIKNISTIANSSKRIRKTLTLISFSNALLNLPYLVTWSIFYSSAAFSSEQDLAEQNFLFALSQISEIFYILNYSVKFYVYMASGSVFRNQLKYSSI